MMYAFAKEDAARSFREVWRRDPNCAICHWGEAWAWGSYLNGPMTPEPVPFAYAATQRARELARTVARERVFIDAMVPRYVETFDPDRRREQDMAYVDSMRASEEGLHGTVRAGQRRPVSESTRRCEVLNELWKGRPDGD